MPRSDGGADGQVRQIELDRERVVLRRAVRGIRMNVGVPIAEFRGVSLRLLPAEGEEPAAVAVMLEHRDSGLSVPLFVATDGDDAVAEWKSWARVLGLPLLVVEGDGSLREPFQRIGGSRVGAPQPRRRRRAAIKWRRPVDPDAAQARPAGSGAASSIAANARSSRGTEHDSASGSRDHARPRRTRVQRSAPRTGSGRRRGSIAEHAQARSGSAEIDARDLPGEMRRERQQAPAQTRGPHPRFSPASPISSTASAENSDERRRVCAPNSNRGRFQADQRVVLAVLVGVDRVVVHHPGDRSRHRAGRPADRAGRTPPPSPSAHPRRTRGRGKSAASR